MPKTYYVRRGTSYRPTNSENLVMADILPASNFVAKFDQQMSEFFLDSVSPFEMPSKVYGSIPKTADRIIHTFLSRPSSTGVLLAGEKGSGKSLLAKVLAARCGQLHACPTILVNEPHHGDTFNAFIQSITQPAVVLFDEFEKVYDQDDQNSMLTLLDGVYPSKKLFILTCNDAYRINEHMQNRPGRIFYSIGFDGITEEDVRCYCSERLENKKQIDSVVRYSQFFKAFSFDMLQALVEEMNRFNETVAQAHKMLNAQPRSEYGNEILFKMYLFNPQGKPMKIPNGCDNFNGAPFIGRNRGANVIEVYGSMSKSRKREEEYTFYEGDAVLAKCINGRYVYKNKEGYVLELHPRKPAHIDYSLLV